jgi:hydrogenase maturation factor
VTSCDSHHCVTCADEGVAVTVVQIDAARGLALCEDEDGTRVTVETELVEPVGQGDRLLVHAGTALVALR